MTRPFIPLPGGARASLVFNLQGTAYLFVNTLHFYTVGGFDLAALQALNTALVVWDYSYYSPLRSAYMGLITIQSAALDTEHSPQWITHVSPVQYGDYSDGPLDFQLTKTCHFVSAARGRGQQGRVNVPPITGYMKANPTTMPTGYCNALSACFEQLRMTMPTLVPPMQLIIASYREHKVWKTTATWVSVQACVVENTRINTLRRRLRQVGP